MDENSKTVEQVAISLQDIKNYIGTNLTPLHSITANLQKDNEILMNGMFWQAQVIWALEAKLEDIKKLIASAISNKSTPSYQNRWTTLWVRQTLLKAP